jgi:glycosyltransferase involved in cell wall biosynthesis
MIIGYEAKRVFHNRSGLGNYARSLIKILAHHTPENTYRLYNPSKGKIVFGDGMPNVTEVRPPVNNKLLANLWRQKLVSMQAAKEGVQIFHGLSHELPADLKKNGVKSVVTIHDLIFMRYPHLYKWIDRKIYIKKVKLAVKRADKIVAISHQTKSDLMELLHVPQEKIEVIYQGCNAVFKKKIAEEEIEQIKANYSLPKEYILFVGTLEERKNVSLILEANLSLKLPIVLIGKHTKYWKKLVTKKKYQAIQSLVFSPTVSDNEHLAAIYQGAKVFVYPSQFEGFGIPVIEALHSHIPVITSNSSSLPEAAGKGSKLVDIQTAEPLKEAISVVWQSESLRKEMIEAGKEHIRQFSDTHIAKSWTSLYESMLQ